MRPRLPLSFYCSVFSSKRYGHERAFQMAVNCKEADKAQAAGGVGGASEGASGGPGVPPQDVFAAPTPKGQTAAASPAVAGGSRRNRNTAARRQQQQQQHPHVRACSPGGSSRGPDMYVTTMRQGEGDDDEAMDSATDTRTDEGSVGLFCCLYAGVVFFVGLKWLYCYCR